MLALQGVALSIALPTRASADGFSVNPTRLELKPSQRSTTLSLTNYNSATMFMQVRIYRWERKQSADVLSEVAGADAPLATPPLFKLSPGGGSQIVRLGFPSSSTAQTLERQWRVIVEEVPQSLPTPGAQTVGDTPGSDADTRPLSISIHMRVSLPLFERPAVVRQALEWQLSRVSGSNTSLIAENLGTVTERLDDISLTSQDRQTVHLPGPLYVFPGERRSFGINPETTLPAGSLHLSLQGTSKPLTRELVLSAQ